MAKETKADEAKGGRKANKELDKKRADLKAGGHKANVKLDAKRGRK
jgi:hypothetical protein